MRVPIYIIYFKVLKGKKLVLILVDQNMLNENNSGLGALTSHCWGNELAGQTRESGGIEPNNW